MSRSISSPPDPSLSASGEPVFNFALALPGRASSRHTQRAYFRWVERYLVDIAGVKPSRGISRPQRMQMLPVPLLQRSLSAPQLRAWLGMLAAERQGKQSLQQARAAVCTLASLLSEAGWIDDFTSAAMHNVSVPRAEGGQRAGRWLSIEQLHELMRAGRAIATTENQLLRNQALLLMLCTMALRREEIASARWDDLSLQNNRPVLRVHGKGRKVAAIDMPRSVVAALERWRIAVSADDPRPLGETPLLRRIWKGGRISKQGLSADGVWLVVAEAAEYAGIGHVAPHDLRRSVAGALQHAGTPIEKISRLLRHNNAAITERYLSKLPQRNEGAVLMSEVLGFDEEL